jgi:hypothetical protein
MALMAYLTAFDEVSYESSSNGVYSFITLGFFDSSLFNINFNEVWKVVPPLGGLWWHPYSPKLRVANNSPRGPLPCLHSVLVDSSKNKLLFAFNFALLGSKLVTFR